MHYMTILRVSLNASSAEAWRVDVRDIDDVDRNT